MEYESPGHPPRPKNNKPDFAFSPILGPGLESSLELLELKGPTEKILNRGDHRGFEAKVSYAINQARDYARYMRDLRDIASSLICSQLLQGR